VHPPQDREEEDVRGDRWPDCVHFFSRRFTDTT
jgi:hypothetical protein